MDTNGFKQCGVWQDLASGYLVASPFFYLSLFFLPVHWPAPRKKKTSPNYPKTECSVPSLKYLTHTNLVLERCH